MIRRRLLLSLPFALAATRASAAGNPASPFVVIIHPQNPYVSLERSFVSDAFLKKTTRWPDGNVIKPLDLPSGSPIRERFSTDVLKRSVAAVKSYWEQIIFSGRDVPPPELANEDEVLKYVLAHAGAVGYVSGSIKLGDARAVTIHE